MQRSLRIRSQGRGSPRLGAVLALSMLLAVPVAAHAQSAPAPTASSAPQAPGSPSGSPGGTIVFERADYDGAAAPVFAIAPDGTGLRQLSTQLVCCLALSPDGKRVNVAAIDSDGNFTGGVVLNTDGSGSFAIPATDATLKLGPSAWLNADVVAFQGWDDSDPSRNGVYLADPTDMSTLGRLTTNPRGGNDAVMAVSADASRIAFVRTSAGTRFGELYAIDADGTHEVRLSPPGLRVDGESEWGRAASWSPDGQRVAFVTANDGGQLPKVYVVDADGGNIKEIFHSDGQIFGAHWSPNGQWIAFESLPAGPFIQGEVALVHPDGSGLKMITSGKEGSGSWAPQWSPDGSMLVFQRQLDEGAFTQDLWTANADGSNPVQITHDPGHYSYYVWGP